MTPAFSLARYTASRFTNPGCAQLLRARPSAPPPGNCSRRSLQPYAWEAAALCMQVFLRCPRRPPTLQRTHRRLRPCAPEAATVCIRFDAAYFSGSLTLMPDPPAALRCAATMLKLGGRRGTCSAGWCTRGARVVHAWHVHGMCMARHGMAWRVCHSVHVRVCGRVYVTQTFQNQPAPLTARLKPLLCRATSKAPSWWRRSPLPRPPGVDSPGP